jgi:hypothetical protein
MADRGLRVNVSAGVLEDSLLKRLGINDYITFSAYAHISAPPHKAKLIPLELT